MESMSLNKLIETAKGAGMNNEDIAEATLLMGELTLYMVKANTKPSVAGLALSMMLTLMRDAAADIAAKSSMMPSSTQVKTH